MPRIAKSAEIGDSRSHTFIALLPKETIADPTIPNSCTSCHKHKDADLFKLQEAYDKLTQRPQPPGPAQVERHRRHGAAGRGAGSPGR